MHESSCFGNVILSVGIAFANANAMPESKDPYRFNRTSVVDMVLLP